MVVLFFFNDTATTEIYTLSLHDALPICRRPAGRRPGSRRRRSGPPGCAWAAGRRWRGGSSGGAPLRVGAGGGGGGGLRLVPLAGDGTDQQVGDEADGEQADHDEQRRAVVRRDQLAGGALGVQDAVDDQRPRDTGGRPGGQQPAVDGAHLVGAEQVAQVGRDRGEATAVEADDDRGGQHEDPGRGAAEGGQDRSAEGRG